MEGIHVVIVEVVYLRSTSLFVQRQTKMTLWQRDRLGWLRGCPCSFTNQVLAQLDFFTYWKDTMSSENDVYLFQKHLDEQVATLRPLALIEVVTVFAREHADFSGVKIQGPFKSGHFIALSLSVGSDALVFVPECDPVLVEVLEGNLGIQERCLPLAETAR